MLTNMLTRASQSSKALVAVLGAALAVLTTTYAAAKWEPGVVAGLTALLVYLVPNAPKSAGNTK